MGPPAWVGAGGIIAGFFGGGGRGSLLSIELLEVSHSTNYALLSIELLEVSHSTNYASHCSPLSLRFTAQLHRHTLVNKRVLWLALCANPPVGNVLVPQCSDFVVKGITNCPETCGGFPSICSQRGPAVDRYTHFGGLALDGWVVGGSRTLNDWAGRCYKAQTCLGPSRF